MKIKLTISTIFFLLMVSFVNASDQKPITIIMSTVDSIISILKDNESNILDKKHHQRSIIWEKINNSFNFNELSKKTLSHYWHSFSVLEKMSFSDVFGVFLGNIYINRIQKGYKDQEILYISEEFLNDNRAIVKTKIVKNNIITPIDYKLIKTDNTWKIYDIVVEGVSLVSNYRTQFKSILRKETPAQLIEKLNQKIVIQETEN